MPAQESKHEMKIKKSLFQSSLNTFPLTGTYYWNSSVGQGFLLCSAAL